MSEYTPTTDDILNNLGPAISNAEFFRWYAAEIAKAKAEVLREFADFADDQDTAESARKYAERVEEEAGI